MQIIALKTISELKRNKQKRKVKVIKATFNKQNDSRAENRNFFHKPNRQ